MSFVFAQETTSEIQGTVKNGNVAVASATVQATHQPTGTVYTVNTRKDGRYNLSNLRVGGPYIIKITNVGYKEQVKENVFLTLGQVYNADFSLAIESKELATVVVSGSRQDKVFNNNRTGSQEVVTRSQIERLPTISRSLQDFTKLSPSSNGLSFGGVSSSYNNLTVDGANFNNAFGLSGTLGGQTNSQPISIDAIEQIQVNISPYDVRQGSFSGAGINSVTRSGTNKFKGSVYNFFRSENSQGYKVNTVTAVKTPIDYNQFGASIGGPILKNKVFFFGSYEQEKISLPGSPTWRAAKPGETSNGTSISQATTTDLDALKAFLISKFGYDPGTYDNYNYRTESKKATVRLDWNINSKNTFTIKYNFLESLRDLPASNSGAQGSRQPSVTGMPFSGNGYTINNNFNIFIGELNTRFSNKANNKLQIGFTALRDFRAPLAKGKDFPLVDILNGQGATYTSFGYEPFTYNNKLNSDIFQFSDIYTRYEGSHEITVGTQNYIKKFQNGFAPNYQGYFRFNTLADFYASANNPYISASQPGTQLATIQRLSYASTKDGSFPFAEIGALELGFFAQDKWRVKPNLTVTYGVRADIPTFDNKFATNDSLKALSFRDGLKVDVGLKPPTRALISPRVGFNWDINNDKKTQIRGGVGLFAGPPPFVWISNQAGNNGVQFGSFALGNGSAANLPFSPDPNAFRPGPGLLSTSYNIAVTDKDFRYPQNLKASIGIDQKLPNNWTVTVEGTYNKDVNAVYFQNINLPYNGIRFAGADPRVRYNSPQIYAGTGGATLSNPNISDAILMKNSNKGYGYFATLQVQKTAKNFTGSIAYTYSQAKTINDGGSIAQSNWRDRPVKGDPNTDELGYANFYQPHRVIAYATYRKEYAKYFATSIGFTFEAAANGTASYVYNGDINGDGQTSNDLMYVPKDQSEIVLVKASTADPRSIAQIWAQLNNYISQDPYLSKRRGQVVERNGALAPYFKKLNMNFTQDFYYDSKDKNRHTIRVTVDIFNVGNLINKQWGVTKSFNRTSPLNYVGVNTDGKPVFSFPYLDNTNQVPLTSTYRDNTGIDSRWQMQIGVRYLFN
ncbi:carboxypeptidase regulatory-like domain-containing protein [Ferruginibacter yonginensis]|uniref:Carboxypeptidase regulatory-like domain-containing protein n=1 Tax=Ferruginibacter yonginensis TaxID=1310416 RepID=A0ABV8QPV9_9BACT